MSKLTKRRPLHDELKVEGWAPVDRRCLNLMHRATMRKLRGFHAKQRAHVSFPMPPRVASC